MTTSPGLDQLLTSAPSAPSAGFGHPYQEGGTTVIPVTVSRGHTARRRPDPAGRRSAADAEMSGTHPLGALVVRDGAVSFRPTFDVSRMVVPAEAVIGAVL